ncbi:hypothetical protein HH214_06170 [Mucilaginibacter robiniae]|uniref:Uncharacterized protein n=1 Tax=Mucilaginibacter robiniae TaxID=2728022 RepID=A0A7L5DZ47_9SPHI|nr:hypothetical protein [Mucilaginibacter robiniae]QJD95488.1 hypothetical protein HH214_06170 [Mucilaginibacter robiniae]
MNVQLRQIQHALQTIVLHFAQGQRLNLEGNYNTKINAAETHLRVIANKRAPYLLFQLMQELHITQAIELDKPVASAQYVVHILDTIHHFEQIWEKQLEIYGQLAKVKLTLNALDELLGDAERNYQTLQQKQVQG